MKGLLTLSFCILLFAIRPSLAASVYRCVDETGHLTFTRQGCPAGQVAQIQETVNPTPGSERATPLAKPKPQRKDNPRKRDSELTVVGVPDDGCGNRITGSARRNAMISQQVQPGMTRADVESTFGTPDSITSRNGQTQYRYSQPGRMRTISFDENGCVSGKR